MSRSHIVLNFPANFCNMPLLKPLEGVKRQKGSSIHPKRLPITMNILCSLKNSLLCSSYTTKDQLMLWAAFTTAFFSFLRSSELCCPLQWSSDKRSCLLFHDVTFLLSVVLINIEVSKTYPFGNGQQLHLASTNRSICPYRTLVNYISPYQKENNPSLLLTFSDGYYLTRPKLTPKLSSLTDFRGLSVHLAQFLYYCRNICCSIRSS